MPERLAPIYESSYERTFLGLGNGTDFDMEACKSCGMNGSSKQSPGRRQRQRSFYKNITQGIDAYGLFDRINSMILEENPILVSQVQVVRLTVMSEASPKSVPFSAAFG